MKIVGIAGSFASLPFREGEEGMVRCLSGRLSNINKMELEKKEERVEGWEAGVTNGAWLDQSTQMKGCQ